MTIKTVKIKPNNEKSQGEFVIINASDFDEEKHELFDVKPRKPRTHNKPKAEPVVADETKKQTGSGNK